MKSHYKMFIVTYQKSVLITQYIYEELIFFFNSLIPVGVESLDVPLGIFILKGYVESSAKGEIYGTSRKKEPHFK